MKRWHHVKLRDCVSILGDGLHGTPAYSPHGEYAFINGNNLSSGHIAIREDTKRVSVDEYRKYKKDLNDRTILVSINGTIGNTALYRGEKCILGKSACYLNVTNEYSKKFIYYILKNLHFQNYIVSVATGTTIKNVSLKQMREYEFLCPSRPEQERIAKVLSSIDDKIELNAQINHNLEEQAKAIFKSWFVDFEPFQNGKFVDSELGKIPEGWRVAAMSEVTSEKRAKVGKQILKVFSAVNTGELKLSEDYFTKQVFSKDIGKYIVVEPLSFAYNPARINIGSIGINDMGYAGCVSPVYVVFSAENRYHHFINFLIKRPFFKEELKTRSSGSVRQSLGYKDFGLIKTVYPPLSIIEQFNKVYEPILDRIKHNLAENTRLITLRDTLLPKLMSGEIDVSEVEV